MSEGGREGGGGGGGGEYEEGESMRRERVGVGERGKGTN